MKLLITFTLKGVTCRDLNTTPQQIEHARLVTPLAKSTIPEQKCRPGVVWGLAPHLQCFAFSHCKDECWTFTLNVGDQHCKLCTPHGIQNHQPELELSHMKTTGYRNAKHRDERFKRNVSRPFRNADLQFIFFFSPSVQSRLSDSGGRDLVRLMATASSTRILLWFEGGSDFVFRLPTKISSQ